MHLVGQGALGLELIEATLVWLDRSFKGLCHFCHMVSIATTWEGRWSWLSSVTMTPVQAVARSVANVLSPLSIHLPYRVVPHAMEVSTPSFNLHVNLKGPRPIYTLPQGVSSQGSPSLRLVHAWSDPTKTTGGPHTHRAKQGNPVLACFN